MARQVSDFSANRLHVRPGERYGIEVEAEGCPLEVAQDMRWSDQFNRYWSMTADGSLRNGGIEFLSKPLPRTYVSPAIDALWAYFGEGRMVSSVRTGIHIHCNCLGLDTDDVTRILLHYALLEPQMFAYVGPTREENIYCIPWYRGMDEPIAVRRYLTDGAPPRFGIPRADEYREPCKYSAVYVSPLSNFGSIEFRHAPTWTDPVTMFRWWQMVQAVWRTHLTEYDVLARWRELGPVGFAREILPFDWLDYVDERAYDDFDVETVASLLLPPEPMPTTTWGRAPELDVAATGAVAPVGEETLTVNVASWRRGGGRSRLATMVAARNDLNRYLIVEDEPSPVEEETEYEEESDSDDDYEEREEF